MITLEAGGKNISTGEVISQGAAHIVPSVISNESMRARRPSANPRASPPPPAPTAAETRRVCSRLYLRAVSPPRHPAWQSRHRVDGVERAGKSSWDLVNMLSSCQAHFQIEDFGFRVEGCNHVRGMKHLKHFSRNQRFLAFIRCKISNWSTQRGVNSSRRAVLTTATNSNHISPLPPLPCAVVLPSAMYTPPALPPRSRDDANTPRLVPVRYRRDPAATLPVNTQSKAA
jgi:hypothetical protein